MKTSERGLRPALANKLQEYLNFRKDYLDFRNLNHSFLRRAFVAGRETTLTYEQWREQLAKEEHEKNKRTRS